MGVAGGILRLDAVLNVDEQPEIRGLAALGGRGLLTRSGMIYLFPKLLT